jgi:hypothetical protein
MLCTQVNIIFLMFVMLLECISNRASLKNMPGHGGNRTYKLKIGGQKIAFSHLKIMTLLKSVSPTFSK